MLFAVILDLGLLFFFLLQLEGLQLFVFFVDFVDFLPVQQVPVPALAFFLLFFADGLIGFQFEQMSFLHFLPVLVDVLLLDLLVLPAQVLLEFFQPPLLLLLAPLLLLLSLLYLVLHSG